ncbi:helix-turn-helix transcriptional regulator [Streptomyces sp. NPDC001793]|uniref:helix-turn-helix domain-containing protein n=1 Tax=Streptomyces sp. NPDC001793 TaxID=3154657 RepID=UPI00331F5F6C
MPPRRVVTGRSQEPRKRFAEELRLLRRERGVSLRDLAKVVGWDPSLFGKLENGQTLGGPEVAQALDTYYGTPGLLLAMWEMAAADPSQFKEQFRRYMELEAEAISLWHYCGSVLHGLLQTREYARELLAMGGLKAQELDQQVDARIGRQKVLEGDDGPPFRAILSEAALRNSLRDSREWQQQLKYLVEVSRRPNVTLYLLPFGGGLHGLMDTAVTFLRLLDGRTVTYVENVVGSEMIQEASRVEDLQRRYDAIRDMALNPAESLSFILRMLEEVPCEPST